MGPDSRPRLGTDLTRLYILLALALFLARWCHRDILWVDEAYPMAAAVQLLDGRVLYRDVWFDKPPLYAWLPLAWGAYTGLPARLAGAVFSLLCCWLAGALARHWWDRRAEAWAASLMAFFLIFYLPGAVIPLAPDLLTIPFALAAVLARERGRTFAAGAAAGAALWANAKALYLLPLCLWSGPALAGFATVQAAGAGLLAAQGALMDYWRQVWQWGSVYARDTPFTRPLVEGLLRTLNWFGFHAAAAGPGACFLARHRSRPAYLLAAWFALALGSVWLGLRFFPRYYFALLPPVVLAGAGALTLLRARWALAGCLVLLLIPAARFGPRYVRLAFAGPAPEWSDLAMAQDAASAARELLARRQPGDTLLVWGYRPEIFALTRMPAGSRFMDSQPLTGVIADRHLRESTPTFPELARRHRAELIRTRPAWIVDGLGPYNPALAITAFPDLAPWLSQYTVAARTPGCVLYRLHAGAVNAPPKNNVLPD